MKITKDRIKEIIREEIQNIKEEGDYCPDDEEMDESWDSPQGYSSKEAGKIVDGALRDYAKDLRKLQYRVVKDWMSKAKSGVMDYFDLVRGLETGDISRAHPYETRFFKAMLDRDKIMNRFRSYFGGKKGKRNR